jgi:hypothetical protein
MKMAAKISHLDLSMNDLQDKGVQLVAQWIGREQNIYANADDKQDKKAANESTRSLSASAMFSDSDFAKKFDIHSDEDETSARKSSKERKTEKQEATGESHETL